LVPLCVVKVACKASCKWSTRKMCGTDALDLEPGSHAIAKAS